MSNIQSFHDNRGCFIPVPGLHGYDQLNLVVSEKRFTFRGMHYQNPCPQIKHVKVLQGSIMDFIYHLDDGVLNFFLLQEGQELRIEPEYAHGYLTLEPYTVVAYSVIGEYLPQFEKSKVWHHIPELKTQIETLVGDSEITISEKDKVGK
jgi:dTDP-4-dehydrorhamnose 3,5-epimerase